MEAMADISGLLAESHTVALTQTDWLLQPTHTAISGALIVLLAIYKRKTTFTDTQSLLHRLMLNAFQTGAITASLAIAMLIAFLASKTTNINTGFSYVLGGSDVCPALGGASLRKGPPLTQSASVLPLQAARTL